MYFCWLCHTFSPSSLSGFWLFFWRKCVGHRDTIQPATTTSTLKALASSRRWWTCQPLALCAAASSVSASVTSTTTRKKASYSALHTVFPFEKPQTFHFLGTFSIRKAQNATNRHVLICQEKGKKRDRFSSLGSSENRVLSKAKKMVIQYSYTTWLLHALAFFVPKNTYIT